MAEITYRTFEGPPTEEVRGWLDPVCVELFGPGGSEARRTMLNGRTHIHVCIAFDGPTPVGFKLGYMPRSHYFESWLGGVLPAHRRQGIAGELQRLQHAWCAGQGFRILTTTTSSDNTAMLILNLQHGYTITGTFLDRKDHVKIILQKHLDEEG
jgi:GNAT superfamily N-acetyltransferase